jgi:hypothetical protein
VKPRTGARLEEFLSEESALALFLADVVPDRPAVGASGAAVSSVWVPGIAVFPSAPSAPFCPAPTNGERHHLSLLRIDHGAEIVVGDPCPSCGTVLYYCTVVWPGGRRPPGAPEAAWSCRRCREYYTYELVAS